MSTSYFRQEAQDLEFWMLHSSWTYCEKCNQLYTTKMMPNFSKHLNAISLFVCPAQTFPRIFWTINCPVRICRDDSFLMSFHSVRFTKKLVSVYTTGLYKTHLYYFKGSFYCLLHVESIAALTPLFFGGFLARVC